MGLSSGRMDRLGPPAPSWTHLGSENDNFLINDEYKKKKKKKIITTFASRYYQRMVVTPKNK
jgi:hypothetical protein